jgi:hypothetical protein
MKTYLVLDCLINSDNLDISKYARDHWMIYLNI